MELQNHIVFALKYRRKEFYSQKKAEIGEALRQLCEWKGVKIVEAEECPDHIHMLVEIPPKISVSSFMGYLKGNVAQCCMINSAIENTSIEIENFVVKVIMLIQ